MMARKTMLPIVPATAFTTVLWVAREGSAEGFEMDRDGWIAADKGWVDEGWVDEDGMAGTAELLSEWYMDMDGTEELVVEEGVEGAEGTEELVGEDGVEGTEDGICAGEFPGQNVTVLTPHSTIPLSWEGSRIASTQSAVRQLTPAPSHPSKKLKLTGTENTWVGMRSTTAEELSGPSVSPKWRSTVVQFPPFGPQNPVFKKADASTVAFV
jgi:hypothetical protein